MIKSLYQLLTNWLLVSCSYVLVGNYVWLWVVPEENFQTSGIESSVHDDYDDYGVESEKSETSLEKSFCVLIEALDWISLIMMLHIWGIKQLHLFILNLTQKEIKSDARGSFAVSVPKPLKSQKILPTIILLV